MPRVSCMSSSVVVRLTLNRPEKLNALSVALHTELLRRQAGRSRSQYPCGHFVAPVVPLRCYDITPTSERGCTAGGTDDSQ
jgi:hypothetical protein